MTSFVATSVTTSFVITVIGIIVTAKWVEVLQPSWSSIIRLIFARIGTMHTRAQWNQYTNNLWLEISDQILLH